MSLLRKIIDGKLRVIPTGEAISDDGIEAWRGDVNDPNAVTEIVKDPETGQLYQGKGIRSPRDSFTGSLRRRKVAEDNNIAGNPAHNALRKASYRELRDEFGRTGSKAYRGANRIGIGQRNPQRKALDESGKWPEYKQTVHQDLEARAEVGNALMNLMYYGKKVITSAAIIFTVGTLSWYAAVMSPEQTSTQVSQPASTPTTSYSNNVPQATATMQPTLDALVNAKLDPNDCAAMPNLQYDPNKYDIQLHCDGTYGVILKSGGTLWGASQILGIPMEQVTTINGITENTILHPGDILYGGN